MSYAGSVPERVSVRLEAGLRANDPYDVVAALDDLIVTGPTGTGLMDLQVVLWR